MNKQPSLGKYVDGGNATIDLAVLLQTRMLITATSGQGKSRALRRLLEQLAGMVQMLIIDPEGEFASLREKHDLVICAATGGDAAAHPRTAALLARRLRECKASAVLDLSELKPSDRHRFVKLFLEALVDCPRALWDPCLVVLDEAQMFAPEKGQGESDATSAVIDIATRGRKRGLCLIAATLRVSMLDKSVCAELRNRLIGGTSMDTDVKRLSFDLGMTPRDALAVLKPLERGHFLSYGPALNQRDARELVTGGVFTTHPEVGQKGSIAPPPPTRTILALLPKLADLPKEAEQEARTLDDVKRELAAARRELTLAKNSKPGPSASDLKGAHEKGFAAGVDTAAKATAAELKRLHNSIHQAVTAVFGQSASNLSERLAAPAYIPRAPVPVLSKPVSVQRPPSSGSGASGITAPQQKLLDKLAWLESHDLHPAPKETLAAVADVSPTSGGYFNNLGSLRSAGLIEYPTPGMVGFTDEGRACANPSDDSRPVHEHWYGVVTTPQKAILEALVARHPEPIAKDELAAEISVSPTSGGYFNNLGRLRTLGAIDYPQKGHVALTRHVMP